MAIKTMYCFHGAYVTNTLFDDLRNQTLGLGTFHAL